MNRQSGPSITLHCSQRLGRSEGCLVLHVAGQILVQVSLRDISCTATAAAAPASAAPPAAPGSTPDAGKGPPKGAAQGDCCAGPIPGLAYPAAHDKKHFMNSMTHIWVSNPSTDKQSYAMLCR